VTHLNHPTEYNRLMETAKKRALQLRSDAIDDFWSGAGDGARQALRSATRLAHSIARHVRLRSHLGA
jgi:hypothetical protein